MHLFERGVIEPGKPSERPQCSYPLFWGEFKGLWTIEEDLHSARRKGIAAPYVSLKSGHGFYLSIYISTYIAPLQGNYSEALPAQAWPKKTDEVWATFVSISMWGPVTPLRQQFTISELIIDEFVICTHWAELLKHISALLGVWTTINLLGLLSSWSLGHNHSHDKIWADCFGRWFQRFLFSAWQHSYWECSL